VYDRSTYQTPAIVAAHAAREARITLLRQHNSKLPAALNTGFRAATGEFFTWLSDDNRLKPGFLEAMIGELKSRPDCDMLYGNIDVIDEDGAPLRESDWYRTLQHPPSSEHIHFPDDTSELNMWGNNHIGAAFLYRAAIPYLIGEYDERRFGLEDYDYWMRINAALTLRHTRFTSPLYDYRLHGRSLSSRDQEIGITRGRGQLVRFEQYRRSILLGPLTWTVDYASRDVRAAECAGRLGWLAKQAEHRAAPNRVEDPPDCEPSVHVRITSRSGDLQAAAPDRPSTSVLVYCGGGPLPSRVAPGWTLAIAIGRHAAPVRTVNPFQGWLMVRKTAALFTTIDLRARAEFLKRRGEAPEAFQPAAVADGFIRRFAATVGQWSPRAGE
jgi:hypothetical protein